VDYDGYRTLMFPQLTSLVISVFVTVILAPRITTPLGRLFGLSSKNENFIVIISVYIVLYFVMRRLLCYLGTILLVLLMQEMEIHI